MFKCFLRKRKFSFKSAVDTLLQKDVLESDKFQEVAINYISKLERDLKNLNSVWNFISPTKTRGAYIYGSVGSGKTMLMDLFFKTVEIDKKSRYHFNQFMLHFHSRLKDISNKGSIDPLKELVDEYCERTKLLCLDEFQVTDIADAMILKKLLSSFIEKGMTIVTTSNRHPDDLYLNGIQRDNFIPCIELIKSSMELINLTTEYDHRIKKSSTIEKIGRCISPLSEENGLVMNELFKTSCPEASQIELKIMGRTLIISEGKLGQCAKFTFNDLFVENKSAADYIEIVKSFRKIFLFNVPEIKSNEMRDEIRRIITFIDQAYEEKTVLYVQSQINLIDNLEKLQNELNPSFDEAFALSRTISRLKEMI